jgi:hypothetical protein
VGEPVKLEKCTVRAMFHVQEEEHDAGSHQKEEKETPH